MDLKIYPLLSTRSKRAFLKTKRKFGNRYQYIPRWNLVLRLSSQLNLSVDQVWEQIYKERVFLVKEIKNEVIIF